MDKSKKYERAQQEDALFEKMIYWIVTVLVLEFILMLFNRYYINYDIATIDYLPAIHSGITALCALFPLCAIASAFWHKKAKTTKGNATCSFFVTLLFVALSCCTIVVRIFRNSGLSLLYLVVPAVAVLAIIYYLYQREFFYMATLTGLGLLAVRFSSQTLGYPIITYVYVAIFLVVIVATLVMLHCNQTGKPFKIAGKPLALLPAHGVNSKLIVATCVILVLVVAASLITPLYSIYYGILVAWLLISAVYYTVKMM